MWILSHTNQLLHSADTDWVSYKLSLYLVLVQTSQVKGSAWQDCTHFRQQSQVSTTHNSDHVTIEDGSFP